MFVPRSMVDDVNCCIRSIWFTKQCQPHGGRTNQRIWKVSVSINVHECMWKPSGEGDVGRFYLDKWRVVEIFNSGLNGRLSYSWNHTQVKRSSYSDCSLIAYLKNDWSHWTFWILVCPSAFVFPNVVSTSFPPDLNQWISFPYSCPQSFMLPFISQIWQSKKKKEYIHIYIYM